MAGILAFGAHVPVNRLEHVGIERTAATRRVAGPDEDSLTMAVGAALDCLRGSHRFQPDYVGFATTTPPYAEKQAAPILATALALPDETRTVDVGHSVRAGTTAMLTALDAVTAGSAHQALVCAADTRPWAPGSIEESASGDGAAALVLGKGDVVAEILGTVSLAADWNNQWRGPADPFVRTWEERFAPIEQYPPLVSAAVAKVLERAGLTPAGCHKLILYLPQPRANRRLAAQLGFRTDQILDHQLAGMGSAGAAHAGLALVAALESAQPGERLLLVAAGDGVDALLLQVTPRIRDFAPRQGFATALAQQRPIAYERYLHWRDLMAIAPPRRPTRPRPSAPAAWRKRLVNMAFCGARCRICGTAQFPPPRICIRCRARDEFEPLPFACQRGRVQTYTTDYLALSPDPPTPLAVVDFDGGGRAILEVTDCAPGDLRIGLPVEVTFRRLFAGESLIVYYWKARPVHGGTPA